MPAVLVTAATQPASAVSLGYSHEAPLTLAWSPELLRLSRTEVWAQSPGDSALASVGTEDEVGARQVLLALARDRFGGLLQAQQDGEQHRRLAEELAGAFAQLRLDVSAADLAAVGERDVFQLFHQLLFIRFHEDRYGPVEGAARVSGILAGDERLAALSEVIAIYASRFNSEVFSIQPPVERMPESSVIRVLNAMVEPWRELRLDFSVTSSDVAGRLYQSFLANTPAVQREGRLFAVASPIDRQRERGAFYTPQPIAELLAERTLSEVLARISPKEPADIRVLDPACGSGAFLLAAYRALARYFAARQGEQLSEEFRIGILTDSLFGGDDDDTAIALTQIQLLEEAAVDSRRLPALGRNIVPANLLLLDSTTAPEGWRPTLEAGGFDVILSNPPFQGPKSAGRHGFDTATLRKRFLSARGTGWNVAAVFVEASLPLLAREGRLAMLLPQALLDGPSAAGIRGAVGTGRLGEVIDFGRNELFAPTMVYMAAVAIEGQTQAQTVLLQRVTARGLPPSDLVEVLGEDSDALPRDPAPSTFSVAVSRQALSEAESWSPFVLRWHTLAAESIDAEVAWFGDPGAPEVAIGTQTGDDGRFVLGPERWVEDGNGVILVDGVDRIPAEFAPPWVTGADIHPFVVDPPDKRVIVPWVGRSAAVDAVIGRLGGSPPSFRPGSLHALQKPKVLVRGLFDEPAAAADSSGGWMIPQGGAGVAALVPGRKREVELLEALLNSALYQWLLQGLGHSKARGYVQLMRHHWRYVPWPSLEADRAAAVVGAGRKVKATLRARGPDRVSRYWSARTALDATVYEAMGVDVQLESIVGVELWRRP